MLADAQGNIWLAYNRSASSYDGSTLKNWADSQELVVGLVNPNTLAFTPYQVYSGLDYVHMQTFTLVNGTPTLVWLSSRVNTDNDVLWPVQNTIYRATYNGSSWNAATVNGSVNHVISEMAAGEENGNLTIGYIMDSDNDYNTSEDRTLVKLTNGQTQILSESAMALAFGVLPGTNSSAFVWNEEGTLHNADGVTAAPGIFSGEYRIVDDSVYYSAATENGAELCLSRYADGKWSDPIFLTDGEGYLENISAVRINGKDYVLGMYTTPVIGEDYIEDSKDLVWSSVSTVSDIVLNGVEFDDEGLEPDQTIPVTLTVLNASDHAVRTS